MEDVGISLSDVAIVSTVQGNGLTLDVVVPRVVRQVSTVVEDRGFRRDMAGTVAEVVDFVHVEPKAVEGEFLVEAVEHVYPVPSGVWVEEIHEDRVTGPYFANVRLSARFQGEHSPPHSFLKGGP